MTVTADSTLWTADTHCVTADGRIICIDAAVAEAAAATETLDAVAVPAVVIITGGYYRPRPLEEIVGVGDGILPRLVGEAHGEVDNANADIDAELLLLLLLAA